MIFRKIVRSYNNQKNAFKHSVFSKRDIEIDLVGQYQIVAKTNLINHLSLCQIREIRKQWR